MPRKLRQPGQYPIVLASKRGDCWTDREGSAGGTVEEDGEKNSPQCLHFLASASTHSAQAGHCLCPKWASCSGLSPQWGQAARLMRRRRLQLGQIFVPVGRG